MPGASVSNLPTILTFHFFAEEAQVVSSAFAETVPGQVVSEPARPGVRLFLCGPDLRPSGRALPGAGPSHGTCATAFFGEADRAYCLRFRDAAVAKARLEARVLLRSLLDGLCGGEGAPLPAVLPGSVRLLHDRSGCPRLEGLPMALSFSYACPDGRLRPCVLLGFRAGAGGLVDAAAPLPRLGVDILAVGEVPPSDRGLHPAELAACGEGRPGLPLSARDLRALSWTVKEAVLKAHGTGLGVDPARLDVMAALAGGSVSDGSSEAWGRLRVGDAVYAWRCRFTPQLVTAVAVAGSDAFAWPREVACPAR